MERLLRVRAAPAAGAHAHHEAHAALGVGLVAHLEVGDRAAAVAVHHAPADLAGAGDDELDSLRRRHDPGLARPEAGLPHDLQLVGLAGDETFQVENAVGAGGLLAADPAGTEGGPAGLARGARGDIPARRAGAGLVAHDPADRRPRLEDELERLCRAGLGHVDRVHGRPREAGPPRGDRVVSGLQPPELEPPVRPGLSPQLAARADERHLRTAAAGPEGARARQVDLGPAERPPLLVLHDATDREPAAQDDAHARARPARREGDAADRALLVLVVAHVEPLVLAGRETRGPERAVAARAHGAFALHAAHEGPEHVLAAARHHHRRALDRTPLLVDHAARERRAAGERDVLRLRLPGGDRDRSRPRHEAVVLGGDAVRLGRQPAHRVAAVRARAREELPARGPGHDADAGEGSSVRRVHDPPGERRGRGEGDRDGLGGCALSQHRRGAAAVPAVGHERARLARRAVEEEGTVRARLHPARRLRAPLEPDEGARAGARRSARVTVPRRTCPSASVTGRASAPARTGCLSCVAKAGASTRMRFPSSAAASKRNVPSPFVTVDCGRPEAEVASCGRRPPPAHRVTVAPTTGPPRSSTTRPARARAFGSRTSPASSPPESKSRSSTRGAAGAPENDSRTAAPAGPGTVTANVPSGRVVPEASGFGRSSRRASRRAAANPSSNGSTATATPAAGFPSTSTRPRISPAGATAASAAGTAAGNRMPKDRAAANEGRRQGDMTVLPEGKVRRS